MMLIYPAYRLNITSSSLLQAPSKLKHTNKTGVNGKIGIIIGGFTIWILCGLEFRSLDVI